MRIAMQTAGRGCNAANPATSTAPVSAVDVATLGFYQGLVVVVAAAVVGKYDVVVVVDAMW